MRWEDENKSRMNEYDDYAIDYAYYVHTAQKLQVIFKNYSYIYVFLQYQHQLLHFQRPIM